MVEATSYDIVARLRSLDHAMTRDEAADEIERLRMRLAQANESHVHFERECLLRGEEIARLRKAVQNVILWQSVVDSAAPELGGLLFAMYDARASLLPTSAGSAGGGRC
jgi:hypothetical protein